MLMSQAAIERLLQERFHPTYLQVTDDSAKHAGHVGAKQGGHYKVVIVSADFEGKSLLERHRMVYAALEPLKTVIHALAIQAKKTGTHWLFKR